MTNGGSTPPNIRYDSLNSSTISIHEDDILNENNNNILNNSEDEIGNDIILNDSLDKENTLFSISEDQLLNDHYSFKDIKFLEEEGDEFEGQGVDDDYYNGGSNESSKQLPTGKLALIWFYFCLTSYWFCFSALQSSLTTLIWPSQIASIVGDELKEKYLGWMPLFGILMSVITAPLAGALSDYSTSRFGKRRVFMFTGSIIAAIFLMGEAFCSSIYLFILVTMGYQFGLNWGCGAYTGLLPDKVPKSKTGAASGYMAFSNALGNLIGLVGSGVIISYSHTAIDNKDSNSVSSSASSSDETTTTTTLFKTNYLYVHLYLLVILILFTTPTLIGIKESRPRNNSGGQKLTFRKFIKLFHLPKDQYLNFYWVIITRFFQEMGIYSILPFFQFYLADIIGVGEDAAIYTSMMLGLIVITSIPSSIIAGPLSDRYGRKLLVYIASSIMAAATLMFLTLSFKPSLVGVMVSAVVFGCGYGAYQAVDYGLALDVLPNQDTIAKDLGVWHQALVVPQVFAPLISGLVLGALKNQNHLLVGYSLVFSITLFWFILATVMIKPITIYKKDHFIPLDQSSSSIIKL